MYSTIFLCQLPSLTECYIAHKDCPPISRKPSQTMALHVSKCIQVGPDVWNHALEDINSKKSQHNNPPGTIGHSVSMPLPAIMLRFHLDCTPSQAALLPDCLVSLSQSHNPPSSVTYDLEALLSTIQGLVSLYFSIGDPRTIIIVRLHQYLVRYHLSTYTY